MNPQDLDERLKNALAERDKLSAAAQKIQGRKEAAEKALEDLRKEILSKNLDPDSLDQTIEKLETAFLEAVETLERGVSAARTAMTPYMEKTR